MNVRFYHGVPQPIEAACQLIESLLPQGWRIAVQFDDATSARLLDERLWQHPANGFIPHVRTGHRHANETPVILHEGPEEPEWPHHDMLINFCREVPAQAGRFHQVVEFVGLSDEARIPARHRYRHYQQAGATIRADTFDASSPE